jgi:hypothetical protein
MMKPFFSGVFQLRSQHQARNDLAERQLDEIEYSYWIKYGSLEFLQSSLFGLYVRAFFDEAERLMGRYVPGQARTFL